MEGKSIFILYSLLLIGILLVHHRYSHRLDSGKKEVQKWFQLSDIHNHETFELIILAFAIGLFVSDKF